jgi:hypothetical protein
MDNDEQRDYAEEAANAALLANPDPEPDSDVRLSKPGALRFRQLAHAMPYGAGIVGPWRYAELDRITVADLLDYLDRLRERLVQASESARMDGAELAQHRQYVEEARRVHGVLSGEYTVQSVYGVRS